MLWCAFVALCLCVITLVSSALHPHDRTIRMMTLHTGMVVICLIGAIGVARVLFQ